MPATHDCDLITMLGEVKALEPQLKQILYGCVEHVQATKAALYLSASHDLNEKTYEVVTSYQFNDASRKLLRDNDDLVDQLAMKRAGFYVNGLGADQRFSEMLFRQGTDRLLATPLFSRGRLVGFIDMRDKAGKRPFGLPDVDAAKKIADQLAEVLGTKNLFGLAPIKLVETPQFVAAPNVNAERRSEERTRSELTPAATRAIAAARATMSKRQLSNASGKHQLNDRDLEVVRLLLP